jgi:hypothetical protein
MFCVRFDKDQQEANINLNPQFGFTMVDFKTL